MSKAFRASALALVLVLLAACAGPTVLPPASDKPAVVALLDNARADVEAGRTVAAAASLERALRIEPRNPFIWHELARLRLEEGRYDQAANLALRSNSFANLNSLRAKNWHIIGEARSRKGDATGAEQAFRRAAELE